MVKRWDLGAMALCPSARAQLEGPTTSGAGGRQPGRARLRARGRSAAVRADMVQVSALGRSALWGAKSVHCDVVGASATTRTTPIRNLRPLPGCPGVHREGSKGCRAFMRESGDEQTAMKIEVENQGSRRYLAQRRHCTFLLPSFFSREQRETDVC